MTWLLIVLLCVALTPAARVGVKAPVWSELRSRPVLIPLLLVGVMASAMAFRWLYARFPSLLATVTVVAVALSLGMWLRARPSWGLRRGLPPGSLGVGASLDAIAEKDFYARGAARWGPVFKMAQFHRPVVCIADLPLGLSVMESQRANLAQPRLPFGRLSPGNYIEFMNDEHHARYRGILRSALSGRVVNECREGVQGAVREQFARIAANSGTQGVSPDAFLERVAFVSMLRVLCGIAVDDERIDELQRLFGDLGAPRQFVERRPEQRVAPFTRLTALVRELGVAIRDQIALGQVPERSVLSELVRTDAAYLDDDILLGNLVLMVHVTRSNVQGLLRWVLKEHVDHPEHAQLLRDAATVANEGPSRVEALASNFVSETLRLHQSEYFYREVVREIRIGEFRIPSGWLLRVGVRECHDNPAVFPDPHAFCPERFVTRHYAKTEYCPFSDGTHSCFGAGLALMIARAAVTVLALDFDGRVVTDGPAVRDGNRHWSHWRPSLAFTISLARRLPAIHEAAPH